MDPIVYRSLHIALRDAGLLNNKGIPEVYQTAHVDDRIALLCGLMDTDGSCDVRGTATFANTNETLARQAFRLAAGLGLKPSLRPQKTTYDGAPYLYWQMSFQARSDRFAVFNLKRKQECATSAKLTRSGRHGVVSVEPVPSRPVSCIQVDRADGLYLIGEQCVPTHNSGLITIGGSIQDVICDPEVTIAILSNVKSLAQSFLAQIKREFESNKYLKALYSDALWDNPETDAPKWSVQDGIIVKRRGNPKEATIEAHGLVDGQPTGKHFDRLMYDDVVTEKSITSPEQIRKTTVALELSDNLGKIFGTRKRMVGTRWSFADTYGIVVDEKRMKVRIYPATDDGTINGKPVLLTDDRWKDVKKQQRSTVSAQMLLNPLSGTDAMFKSEWLRTYEIIPSVLNVYIMCDPSKGRSKDSDRTAIAVMGVDPGGNKYLLDGVRHRMRLSERYDFLKRFYLKWSNQPGVQMVKVGYEQFGQQADIDVIEEYQQRDKLYFEVAELAYPRAGPSSKSARVERLEPDMRNGRFYLPAVVYYPDLGGHESMCTWVPWTQEDQAASEKRGDPPRFHVGQILYRILNGLTKRQRAMEVTNQHSRIVHAIKRLSEDKDIYDLTRAFIEEARLFPYGRHDDLVDVISRIYDMEVIAPQQFEASATMGLVEDDFGQQVVPGDAGGMLYDA